MEGAGMKFGLAIVLCIACMASVARAEDQPTVIVVVGAEGTPEVGR